VIKYLSLAYQTYHCSAILRCSVCIRFFCTLLYALCSSHVTHCVPSPFDPPFFYSAFQLLYSPPSSLLNPSSQPQPHLFSVPCTYSFCAPCACNVRNSFACSHHTDLLHISSAMPDHRNSSTSLVVPTTRPTSLGVQLRFFILSSS
jgi:hypothetical protein